IILLDIVDAIRMRGEAFYAGVHSRVIAKYQRAIDDLRVVIRDVPMGTAEDVVGKARTESCSGERRGNEFSRIGIERICDLQVRRQHELDGAKVWGAKPPINAPKTWLNAGSPGLKGTVGVWKASPCSAPGKK